MNAVYAQPGHWRTLGGVAALHGAVALALLSVEPAAEAVGLHQPLMVSLLAAPAPEPRALPKPRPAESRVQPQPAQPLPPPVFAAREEAASALTVPVSPPVPTPTPAVLSASEPGPEPAKPVVAAVAAIPAPPPALTPPRFDADYLDNPAPAYPVLSRRLGEEGRVLLRVFVDPEGAAARVEVRDSSGFERLDRAARETVLRWRFVPARQGDQAVAGWVLVPISFNLRS